MIRTKDLLIQEKELRNDVGLKHLEELYFPEVFTVPSGEELRQLMELEQELIRKEQEF